MCSLGWNKNAGHLVVRTNDSTRPSSRRVKKKLLFRGTGGWGDYENADAQEVAVRSQRRGLKLEHSAKKQERSKETNVCEAPHTRCSHALSHLIRTASEIVSSIIKKQKVSLKGLE